MGDVPADLDAAIAAAGDVGRQFAEYDWAAHPLGPPEHWPAELRTAVAAVLADGRVGEVLQVLAAIPSATAQQISSSAPPATDFRGALNAAESETDIGAAFLISPEVSCDAVAVSIGVLDREAGTLRISFVGDIPAELRDRYFVVAAEGPGPMAETTRTGQSIVVEDVAYGDPRHKTLFREFDGLLHSYVFHPLRDSAGVIIGGITLGWPAPRTFDPAHLATIQRSVAVAGPALARVRAVERERQIAVDLQDHLLDLNRTSPAAAVSALYQPAAEAMRVGGDWYLVAPTEDADRVAVCVGDVVGMGLPAATVMTRLRSAIGAASATLSDPAAVLDLVERYAATVRGAHCSTVAFAVLDVAEGTVRYACAGHPYPLIVDRDGSTRYLEDGRRPPLTAATNRSASEPPGVAELRPGSLLFLYTDGLLERRGESLSSGLTRLAAAATACAQLPTGSVCSELLHRMTPPDGYTDDVAMLAVRPVGATPTSFVAVLPADLHEMAPLRGRLRTWLEDVCPEPMTRHDILISVGEALSNAIEHGSEPHWGATVSLEIFADNGRISATVTDSGRWSSDSSASRRETERGRGLTLIHALSAQVEMARTTHGTSLTMRHEWESTEAGISRLEVPMS